MPAMDQFRVEVVDRFFEFAPAARIAEADNGSIIKRQAVFLDGIARPRAGRVYRVRDLEFCVHYIPPTSTVRQVQHRLL